MKLAPARCDFSHVNIPLKRRINFKNFAQRTKIGYYHAFICPRQDDIRKRKISQEQKPGGSKGKSSPNSRKDEDSDDDDDDVGVYEALWDAISPPLPQRTSSIAGKDVRRIEQKIHHIDDFNLLKVLGKGSFGKVLCPNSCRFSLSIFSRVNKSLGCVGCGSCVAYKSSGLLLKD